MAWMVVGLIHGATQVLLQMIFSYFDAARKLRIEIHGVKSSRNQTRILGEENIAKLHKRRVDPTDGIEEQKKPMSIDYKTPVYPVEERHKRPFTKQEEKEMKEFSDSHAKNKPKQEKDAGIEEQKEAISIDYETLIYFLEESSELIKKQEEKEMKECKESYAENKMKQEKEMEEFKESHARNIQEMKEKFETQIDDLKELGNHLVSNYYLAYIGLVCWSLQTNMYHFVLPDHFAENWLYRVKDIEKDINDEDLLSEEERKEALKRWEYLKEKLGWDPSLERTLKMLQQKDGYSMDQPEELTVEEAKKAAEELDKQGRLRGRTSFEKVKKIIEMWRKSADLVQ